MIPGNLGGSENWFAGGSLTLVAVIGLSFRFTLCALFDFSSSSELDEDDDDDRLLIEDLEPFFAFIADDEDTPLYIANTISPKATTATTTPTMIPTICLADNPVSVTAIENVE